MIRSFWRTATLASVFVATPVALMSTPVGAIDVKVESSSGESFSGQFAGSTETAVRLQTGSQMREVPVDQIVSLRPSPPDTTPTPPSMNATLVDETSIFVQDVAMDDSVITLQPRRQSPIKIPIKQVRSIRFRPGTAATDPQWLGLTEKESRTDLMVIRRGNDQLDPIEGVVVGLDATNLLFELDGDQIEAPLDRLEGVLFRSNTASDSSGTVKVRDIYGSIFLADRLEPSDSGDSVDLVLPGQITHTIDLDQIALITWSSGRVMLAAETPASSRLKPYLETKLPADLLADWFAPTADGEDIIATAGGSIEFRVAQGFQSLVGSVNRDPLVANGGTVSVRILVDDQVKWEQAVNESAPKGFQIPVGGALRIRLEVLSGDDGDVGDQVRFLKPRLLK